MLRFHKKKKRAFRSNTSWAFFVSFSCAKTPLHCKSTSTQIMNGSKKSRSLEMIKVKSFFSQPISLHKFKCRENQELQWNGEEEKCIIYPCTSWLIDKIITRLRQRMKTDRVAHMPVRARQKGGWVVEHVHMFGSAIHYAGSCIYLFVMSIYMGNFFHGKLGISKATCYFLSQTCQWSLNLWSGWPNCLTKTLWEHNQMKK